MAGLFFYHDVLGAKKDGLMSPSEVPANAQGECGEDQEAGALRTPFRKQRFPAFYSPFYTSVLAERQEHQRYGRVVFPNC
jgi:hypothetical protein